MVVEFCTTVWPPRYQDEAMFRTQILEQRLARHEMQAIEKFQAPIEINAAMRYRGLFLVQDLKDT